VHSLTLGYLREIGAARVARESGAPTAASDVFIDGDELVAWMQSRTRPHRLLRVLVYDGQFEHTHDAYEVQESDHTSSPTRRA
jgi:hypothetical protein